MGGAPPVIPDYELLRPIGRGAYGEVWLARSVTGMFRAAKVVYRASFEDARPFEREFAGIQRFEPLSRAQENQISILHVGRNETAGYFYYVMELADDAATREEIIPETYVPQTLKEMRTRRKRLPARECLGIGIALARALAHLHRHGLVHRDIKPSNVVFVHGAPKLADIGLVSAADACASFVGTEGFVPPEGPGTVAADVYSLGKVFYEVSTGRDRKEFPRLPEDLEHLPDKRVLLELNEVTLKACDPESSQRYSSAQALLDDLLLLQAGKSVKRLHAIERRFRWAAKYGVAVTALTLAAAAAFFWASFEARRAEENFVLSEQHRVRAEKALWESELNQARARRMTGLAGRRFETLELFRKGAAGASPLDLRNEAIASLVLPDLRRLRRWPNGGSDVWIFDAQLERYLTNDPAGNLIIRDVENDRALGMLPGRGPLVTILPSADYRFIAASTKNGMAHIWQANTEQAVEIEFPQGAKLLGFNSDSSALVVRHANGSLHFLECTTGLPQKSWKGPYTFSRIHFNAMGSLFFGTVGSSVVIYDATNGSRLTTLPHPEGVGVALWHPDGRRLATACGTTVRFWDTAPQREIAAMEGHESRVVGLSFDETGDLLVSTGWDDTTRLWRFDTHSELVRAAKSGNGVQISADGRRLTFQSWDRSRAELWEVADGREVRRLELPSAGPRKYRQTYHAGFHPDGTLLHIDGSDGTYLFDARSLRSVAVLHASSHVSAAFHPSGQSLFTVSAEGVRIWPLETDFGSGLRLGPPQSLDLDARGNALAISHDGRRLVATSDHGFHVIDAMSPTAVLHSQPLERPRQAPAISADGRWLAIARNKQLQIWEGAGDRIVTNIDVGAQGAGVFSPDNRWMVSTTPREYRFWDLATWRAGVRIERPSTSAAWPCAAFTPDGKIVALSVDNHSVRLLLSGTSNEIATLPTTRLITHLCFSPDGTRLLVTYEPGVAEIWDLCRIHAELAALHLEWPDFFAPQPSEPPRTDRPAGDRPHLPIPALKVVTNAFTYAR